MNWQSNTVSNITIFIISVNNKLTTDSYFINP